MDIFYFYQLVGAVILGNGFTGIVVYVVWRATKLEKAGMPINMMPAWLFLLAIIPFLIVAWATLSTT